MIVTPSKAVRELAMKLAALGLGRETALVSCTKGIEHDTGKLMSDILEECLPGKPGRGAFGPNHAVEVAQRIPAAGVIGCRDAELLETLQKTFSLPTFRAYTSDDATGIQLGGAPARTSLPSAQAFPTVLTWATMPRQDW